MPKIPIRNKHKKIIAYALIDKCDKHLEKYRWVLHSHGYAVHALWVKGKTKCVYLHHVVNGRPLNGLVTDHVNGNPLDNRRKNLRIITQRENTLNKKAHRNGKMCGTIKCTRRNKNSTVIYWQARMRIKGKNVFLGYFNKQVEASEAYKKELFRNKALTNGMT